MHENIREPLATDQTQPSISADRRGPALPVLADRRLPAFPCRADKTPATPHGFRDATDDPAGFAGLCRRYPGPLVGMPTGARSGIAVLDIDPDGQGWLAANESRLPATRRHETRRGLHLLFRHRPGMRCNAGVIAPGVDVRAEGGYAIWWPAQGYSARWPVPGAMVAEWPKWLLARLRAHADPEKTPYCHPVRAHPSRDGVTIVGAVERSAPGGSREARFADRAITRAMNAIGRTPAGSRNTALNGEAYALGRLVARGWLAGDLAVFALRHGAALCGYLRDHGEPATLAVIRSGLAAGLRRPYPDLPPLPAMPADAMPADAGAGFPWRGR